MEIKLLVCQKNSDVSQEFAFKQTMINIGRKKEIVDLFLEDSTQIISRKHAQIGLKNNSYYLKDQSSNKTYLNGISIVKEQEYTLKEKDQIIIGNYLITVASIRLQDLSRDEPAQSTNIFLEDIEELARILQRISTKYAENRSANRDFLSHALKYSAITPAESDVAIIVSDGLLEGKRLQPPKDEVKTSADNSFTILVDNLLQLHKARRKFLIEFLGEVAFEEPTVKSKADSISFSRCTAQELIEYLHAIAPVEETERRLGLFKVAMNDVIKHQLSLLAGYKAGVAKGVEKLLQTINPEMILAIARKRTVRIGPLAIPLRYFPVIFRYIVLRHIFDEFNSLSQEDSLVFEKKYFRPGFVSGYLDGLKASKNDEQFISTNGERER